MARSRVQLSATCRTPGIYLHRASHSIYPLPDHRRQNASDKWKEDDVPWALFSNYSKSNFLFYLMVPTDHFQAWFSA